MMEGGDQVPRLKAQTVVINTTRDYRLQQIAIMNTIKGPGIFVVQYVSDEAPFNSLDGIAGWAASLGYKGIQIPVDARLIDVKKAATEQSYCNELLDTCRKHQVILTELSTHLQGQLIAVHPAYDALFDGFAPVEYHGSPQERQKWAVSILMDAAKASKNLGLKAHATFSGSLAWPYMYPWPQRPDSLIDEAFAELAKRWRPILDAFDEAGVDVCYEIHPGEDLHDGTSYDRFLEAVNHHQRACICFDPSHFVLQQLDYLSFVDHYHERIKIFHVKDAEFRPNGKQGVYGGFAGWRDRAGRFRAIGDGQVDFKALFTKLALYGYSGWATLESECAVKDAIVCAREGAPRIQAFIIPMAASEFDDFAGAGDVDSKRILGIER